MNTKKMRFAILFNICAFLLCGAHAVQASGPWKWQRTLTGLPSGKSMVMPSALYVDEKRQRYYVVDTGENRLLSFEREGKFLKSFTAGGQLQAPYDMVRDSEGRLMVVEKGKNSLTIIDIQAKKVDQHELRDNDALIYPGRLEFGLSGVLVLNKANGKILGLDDTFKVVKEYSCDNCSAGFTDFKIAGKKIWALAAQERAVYSFSLNGGKPAVVELAGNLKFPSALAIGPAGRLYILERHEGSIAVFDKQGTFKYRFLSPGQTRSQLYYPVDLLFDPWGNLCVVEEGNGRVQVFSRN